MNRNDLLIWWVNPTDAIKTKASSVELPEYIEELFQRLCNTEDISEILFIPNGLNSESVYVHYSAYQEKNNTTKYCSDAGGIVFMKEDRHLLVGVSGLITDLDLKNPEIPRLQSDRVYSEPFDIQMNSGVYMEHCDVYPHGSIHQVKKDQNGVLWSTNRLYHSLSDSFKYNVLETKPDTKQCLLCNNYYPIDWVFVVDAAGNEKCCIRCQERNYTDREQYREAIRRELAIEFGIDLSKVTKLTKISNQCAEQSSQPQQH